MLVEVAWLSRAATERMHLRTVQTVQRVELHRRKWLAEPYQLWWWRVKFTPLVVGTDDEHTHVAPGSRLDARPIQVIDEVPVQVHVLECVAFDRLSDNMRRRVR